MSTASQRSFPRVVLAAERDHPVDGAELAEGAEGAAEAAGIANPAVDVAAFVGYAALNTLQPRVIRLAADPNVTILVVEQTIHGKSQASLFRLDTTRQLRASINGHVVEYFSPREIVMTVPRGSHAKIVIEDAYAGQHIYRQGRLSLRRPLGIGGILTWLPWLHTETNVNLDSGKENVPTQDAELVMSKKYTMSAVNGTMLAPWYGEDPPSQGVCESLPPQQYSAQFVQIVHTSHSPFEGNWCVHTQDHHYGLLTAVLYNNDPGIPIVDKMFAWKTWGFDYLLWRAAH